MNCKDKCGYPINPAPFAPGDCGPCGPHHPPMPPRPPMKPGCPPSQYIGSRYVPIFADPIEWDINRAYESLTIVTYNGESYTSKCNVGPGIDITNTRYWAKTGAYNAQLEQCKESVKDLSSQVTGFAEDNREFREKITQFEKDNAEIKNTVAEDKARVDALAERVSTAETEIDGLQATTNQHTKELADLHAKDEDLQRQITSNDNDIAAIQAKDLEQDGRLDGIDTKLKSHDASIAQNTSDIAKNTKNIQDNAANIAINGHEIADHAEKLKDHEARLTAQHEEITANHQAIERNTSDITGLRADLTEDEAKIEANRDAIAHIQEKDVQQDGRLDKLEECCEQAKEHFSQLDTKTDETNTKLSEEIDRAKAAEVANGKLIAANAAELADHAEELADHEERITALETHNAKTKSDIADIKAKNVEQDTAIETARDAAAHAQETAAAAEGKADANATTIGSWDANHPGKTISETVTDNATAITGNTTLIENLQHGLSDTNEKVTGLENSKADKTDIGNFISKENLPQKLTAIPVAWAASYFGEGSTSDTSKWIFTARMPGFSPLMRFYKLDPAYHFTDSAGTQWNGLSFPKGSNSTIHPYSGTPIVFDADTAIIADTYTSMTFNPSSPDISYRFGVVLELPSSKTPPRFVAALTGNIPSNPDILGIHFILA